MKRLFRIFFILLAVVALAAALYAWASADKKDGKSKLVTVETGSITEKALAVGQIEPRQKFSIKSTISGIVKKTMVQVGDRVRTGDALFEISPDPTPTDITTVTNGVSSTAAALAKAKLDYQRTASLFQQGLASKSDFDAAKTILDLAQISARGAVQNREITINGKVKGGGLVIESVVRAPASGTVLTRAVNVGDPVVPLTSYQPGTELATVADMGDLLFRGTIDEIDVGKIAVGMTARIKVGALPTDVVTGKVTRIAPQAQQKDGATLFDVWIELDPGSKVTLRAGYSANAEIVIREKKDVLTIPERLVEFEDGGNKAFVELAPRDPKGKPVKTEVKVGISDGLNVEVVSGVSAGQKLVEKPPKEITAS
ncbi:MAG TPA: efflux RND transporter periplasmic adaptor subunit [Thermoanaerobaculia bacterium]|nr:efflux RND transporter periplasmic adaptor subunit [Thermoanaerobaculia bacterium]